MEQQAAIAAELMEGRVRHLMPEGDDWTVIEVLVDILKPFQQAAEALGGGGGGGGGHSAWSNPCYTNG